MQILPLYRRALAAIVAVFLLVAPAVAQQPSSVNPTASSVKEKQLLDALKPGSGDVLSGRVTIPDARSRDLIKPTGLEYRALHQQTMPMIGKASILGILALLVLFYLFRGRIRIDSGRSDRTIVRFGGFDRFIHWLTAMSFILLGLTGLNLVFGKSLLLPLIGPEAFASLTQLGKLVHNYVSFAFALGIVLMFLFWIKDNFPSTLDLRWFVQGGGLIGRKHPPADRFNAGQKLVFWATVLGGIALSVSGYIMMFRPIEIAIAGMQLSSIVHGITGLIMIAIIVAHIYIGTLGMEGAFDAMGSGEVDLNWAKEHHGVWVDKVAIKRPQDISGGRAPAAAE
jgi:formate dehydrogenase subunit gamma